MSASQYTALAAYYDRLNAHVPYDEWAAFLDRTVRTYGAGKENIWLDLGCGTGRFTVALAKMGHEMIGIDLSPDMLMIARERAWDEEQNILWLCQDMRSFELYGTVDAVVSCLDCLNYLPSVDALLSCFRLVNNYLGPGGVFVFDMNTPYKFKTVYADNDIILEEDDIFCGWRNHFDAHHRTCDFDLTLFAKGQNGKWERFEESQREYCYSLQSVKDALAAAGLEVVKVVSDFAESPISDASERWFFICRGTGKE